ncbi:MAG TPA: alpha/beta hydrolase domain-containing protein [Acidimicrobiales bacterium]|nr:alpha/beta hydrolase domain-containing protein [Acidimicrobiales bacterium]
MGRRLAALLGAVFVLTVGAPRISAAAASVPDPTLSTPPSGLHGHAMWDSYYDLLPFGYEDREFFVSGTATAPGGSTAPYTTRIVVTRPLDPTRFNGTVLLDWSNVTAQFENAVDTMEARPMLMREGFAYVHVSAQAAGVCCTPLTPKVWDPVRYAALHHPGDQYANDMFSQIAKAVRAPKNGDHALGALHVDRVLAAGQSQSAGALYKYVNEAQASAKVIDGFLIHGGGKKTFPARLTTKVLNLLSDLEADPSASNPAEPNYRLWEIAGAAHSDFFIGYQSVFGHGPRTLADAARLTRPQYDALMQTAGNYGEQLSPLLLTCTVAGATMPMHYATSTAIHQLDQWVRTGVAPNNGPRFAFAANGDQLTDDLGNARGGIRLPPAEVPVARYKSTVCVLGGITVPLTDVEIQQRYATHAEYYGLMRKATDAAVTAGWLLPPDAIDLMARACAAKNRWGDASGAPCPPYAPPAFNSVLAAAVRATPPAPTSAVLPVTGGQRPLALAAGLAVVALLLGVVRSWRD